MSDRTTELLNKAADRIERDGLSKGTSFAGYQPTPFDNFVAAEILTKGETPAVDVVGAVMLETGNMAEMDAVLNRFVASLGFEGDTFAKANALIAWEDDENTTAEMVVAALRTAALEESNA